MYVNSVTADRLGAAGVVGQTTANQLVSSARRTLSLEEGGALERSYRTFGFDFRCDRGLDTRRA